MSGERDEWGESEVFELSKSGERAECEREERAECDSGKRAGCVSGERV